MDHLDAAMRLFDPQSDTYAIKEYVTKHRAVKGSVKSFVLTAFRTATSPITSRQIAVSVRRDRSAAG